MPSISRPKEWPTDASATGSVMMFPFSDEVGDAALLFADQAGAAGDLRQSEDDELGRLHRRDTDLADDLAGVDAFGRIGLAVALHEERLVGSQTEQRSLAPLVDEEGGDGAADLGPQRVVV